MIPPANFSKRNRDGRLHSPMHLRFIRQRLCCVWYRQECQGRVEASHLRQLAPEYGMGTKPSDLWCVGACRAHHREMESRDDKFAKEYDIDLIGLALDYAEKSPDKRVKAAASAIRSLMATNPTQDEFAKMVEAVLKKIREQETAP